MSFYGIGAGLGQAIPNAFNSFGAVQKIGDIINQRRAEDLAGQWLLSGGTDQAPIQGVGDLGSAGGGLPGYQQMPQAAAPPPVAAPQAAADPMTGGSPTGVMPLDDDPATAQMAQQTASSLDAPYLSPDVEASSDYAPSATPEMWTDPNSPAIQAPGGAPGAPPAPAEGSPAVPADQGAATQGGGTGGNLVMNLPGGKSFDLGQLIHHVDPHQIAQQIVRARPEIAKNPGALWRATSMIYKMAATGDRSQQMATATMLKYLFPTANFAMGQQVRQQEGAANREVRMRGQNMSSADRAAGREVATRGQDIRSAAGAESRQIQRERMVQQAQQFEQRLQQAKAIADPNRKRQAVTALLRAVQSNIHPMVGAAPTGEELAALKLQEAALMRELQQVGGVAMPPPIPDASQMPDYQKAPSTWQRIFGQ